MSFTVYHHSAKAFIQIPGGKPKIWDAIWSSTTTILGDFARKMEKINAPADNITQSPTKKLQDSTKITNQEANISSYVLFYWYILIFELDQTFEIALVSISCGASIHQCIPPQGHRKPRQWQQLQMLKLCSWKRKMKKIKVWSPKLKITWNYLSLDYFNLLHLKLSPFSCGKSTIITF